MEVPHVQETQNAPVLLLTGLAVDWWSLLKNEWIDTGAFKL